ncbi:MAG: RluA family pseudouridine synthase [Bacteroidota bacterium]
MKRIRFKDLVIYEDESMLAINKPANISSLHERFDSEQGSIVQMAKAVDEHYSLCHRIDRETSGVLLIAKNPEAYRHIAMQFEKRTIDKVYHAIVSASVNLQELRIDLPLYTDSKRRVQVSKAKGKESLTEISTFKQYKHFTVLACKPFTGRLHQIRVHAASQNLPLVCDTLYGGKIPYLHEVKKKVNAGEDEKKAMMDRVGLHAYSISFNSLTAGDCTITAPYPNDFGVMIKLLEKYDQL